LNEIDGEKKLSADVERSEEFTGKNFPPPAANKTQRRKTTTQLVTHPPQTPLYNRTKEKGGYRGGEQSMKKKWGGRDTMMFIYSLKSSEQNESGLRDGGGGIESRKGKEGGWSFWVGGETDNSGSMG